MSNTSKIIDRQTSLIDLLFLLFSILLIVLDYIYVSRNFLDFPGKDEQVLILAIFLFLGRMTIGIDFGWMYGRKYFKAVMIVLSLMYFAYIIGLARTYLVWQDFDELEAYVKQGIDLWDRREYARTINDIMIASFVSNLVVVPFFVVRALRSIWRQLRREEEGKSNL